jgi:hypothetical protein
MFSMKKGHRTPPILAAHPEDKEMDPARMAAQLGPKGEPVFPGFDQAAFDQSISGQSAAKNRELCEKYKDEMDPAVLNYWEQYGVMKELFDAKIDDGMKKYSVHTPLHMVPGRRYPLLYFSHGGFQTPFQAETAGFSKLIEKEQFIAVYPFNGGYSNEDAVTEFKRITDALREIDYPIDWTRVYAAGFSSGSDATESIATQWPELIAAAAPCPGSNAMYNSLCRISREAYEKCIFCQVPLICVGGDSDYGDTYPFPDHECYENFNIWMQDICRVKDWKYVAMEEGRNLVAKGEGIEQKIGVPFQKKWVQSFEERNWYFGQQFDAAGRPVVEYVCGEGIPHIMTGCFASVVWEALKHWSRNPETGELIYTPVVMGGVN